MRLPFYFFRQFLLPFVFGASLFSFLLVLDKLFDLIDLILNKGVAIKTVLTLFGLFLPTSLPLALPIGCLLGCVITFGRLSEENELTAVRASGISLLKVLWMPPLFALLLSFVMLPFNSTISPWTNRAFRSIIETIVHADPLIKIEPQKFFSIKNIRILTERVNPKTKELENIFVYKKNADGSPANRIFAKTGEMATSDKLFELKLKSGQIQQFSADNPRDLLHTAFNTYLIRFPLNIEKKATNTRYRNVSSTDLQTQIADLKEKKLETSYMEAELSLRTAIAFASVCLVLLGMPLATVLQKGGKTFGIGLSVVVIFAYYFVLIFGQTLAHKGYLPAVPALWIANVLCLGIGGVLIRKHLKK